MRSRFWVGMPLPWSPNRYSDALVRKNCGVHGKFAVGRGADHSAADVHDQVEQNLLKLHGITGDGRLLKRKFGRAP